MKRDYGWTGKLLRVDLTERLWSVESTEKYLDQFIGGIGVGMKIFWDEVDLRVGALEPENKLILAPGPLTGTIAPASGRFEIVSKSPHSYPRETVSRSGMGGFWGPELKYAGYDALVIQGQADRWINLCIHNDSVEFRDAEEYLGLDTYTTQIQLRKELDSRWKILCIGPTGENLSRVAAIISETSFASGRSGFGAVMGSKKLKAIATRGTRALKVFDCDRVIEISKKVKSLTAENPMREWTARSVYSKKLLGIQKNFINKYRKKNTGCFGCPLQCFAYIEVPGAGASQVHCTSYFYYYKATQYYGSSCERDQALCESFVLANRLGLDTYEMHRMIDFLEDLYQAGLIKSQPELPMDKLGSKEFIRTLYESIAMRKGIGNLLAEGSARVADQIKDAWEFCSKHFPAYGSGSHASIRKYPGIAIQWALDSRDPIIDQHFYLRLSASLQNEPSPYRLPAHLAEKISENIFGSAKAIDHSTFEHKPEAVVWAQNRSAVINLLVLCDWVYPVFHSYTREDRIGDTSLESQLLSAVTGYRLSEEELDQVGERVWNLSRAIMMREGRRRELDTFHESYFEERDGERAIPKSDFEKAKTRYYQFRGWNEKTGWPTREKLHHLGLYDVVEDLAREIPKF